MRKSCFPVPESSLSKGRDCVSSIRPESPPDGVRMVPAFPLSLPGTCHRVADSPGGPWGHVPTPCTYLHTWAPPILACIGRAWGAAPGVIWYTPLSLAKPSDQGPRWGGAGGTLTSGDAISALGERVSTLWMRPSLLVGGREEEGREGLFPPSLGHGGHLGRNQGRIIEASVFKASIPRGMRKCPLGIPTALKTPAVSAFPPSPGVI